MNKMVTVPVEERLAIREVVDLYAYYCDTRHYEKMVNVFTEACLFDETAVGAPNVVTTRAALLQMLLDHADKLGPVMHNCTSHIISAYGGNTAVGTLHVLAEGIFNLEGGQKQPFRIFGFYDDRYVKENGRWYIKSRVLKPLVPSQGAPTDGGLRYDGPAEHLTLR